MSERTDAANIINRILYHCGELSALVPRGPVRDRVDDETEHMGELAEAIGNLPREEWADWKRLPQRDRP